jgi:hypothetical protein
MIPRTLMQEQCNDQLLTIGELTSTADDSVKNVVLSVDRHLEVTVIFVAKRSVICIHNYVSNMYHKRGMQNFLT